MKRQLFTGILISLLVSCTNQENSITHSNIIDVESGLQNITKLKVSDLGKTIRYIPLETTDDCLIGKDPIVKVLKNYIVIEANNSCFLFDKKDGSFISSIGHRGQDPEAYSGVFCRTDEKEDFLYFIRQPNQLIKYDMKGHFAGKTEFSSPPGLANCYLLTDSEIIGYYSGLNNMNNFNLAFFDKSGTLIDTLPPFFSKIEESSNDILSISVIRGSNIYGNWTKAGAIIIDYKEEKKQIIALDATVLWKNDGNIRFKENFVDTVYTITNRKITPYITFNTGKWHWPEQERISKNNTRERIFIADVSENDKFIFFQCIKGLYADDPILYNGLYNKNTEATKLAKYSDMIEDDLTNFMPFNPLSISTSGEFISLVEAVDIMEWIEEHPEAKENKNLTFLKRFDEDMNPVIVLVE
jgi:hypothetical protein